MPQVFISRQLPVESVFLKKLAEKGFDVHGESLLNFSAVAFDVLPTVEWIFFYSQNAVRFFFQSLALSDNLMVSDNFLELKARTKNFSDKVSDTTKASDKGGIRLATIGASTAQFLQQNFCKPNFIGTGVPESTSEAFLKVAKGQSVLFPRARNSRQSIQKLLGSEMKAIDLIVYENTIKKDIQLIDFEILVFTSPLNVAAYFSLKKLKSFQKVVAIGNTTAEALRKQGVEDIAISKKPSESGLVEAVLNTSLKR